MAEISTVKKSSISEYLDDCQDLEISYDSLHYKEKDSVTNGTSNYDLILPSDSILLKYKNDLATIVEEMTLNAEQQRRYFYNQLLLSYDLYGTTEYWSLLLDLNDIRTMLDFNLSKIKVYDGSLPDMIESIMALEEPFITQNTSELTADTLSVNPLDYQVSKSDADIVSTN